MLKSVIRAAVLVSFCLLAGATSAQDIKREITKVAGDVYRFQNKFHFSLVTVTNDGVVIVDPINADAASWLKDNLATITDKPITHLIYSHSHMAVTVNEMGDWLVGDGGQIVFRPAPRHQHDRIDDDDTVIGHGKFRREMKLVLKTIDITGNLGNFPFDVLSACGTARGLRGIDFNIAITLFVRFSGAATAMVQMTCGFRPDHLNAGRAKSRLASPRSRGVALLISTVVWSSRSFPLQKTLLMDRRVLLLNISSHHPLSPQR